MKRSGNPSANKMKMERNGVLSEPQLKTEKNRMSTLTQLNELQMERIRTFPFRVRKIHVQASFTRINMSNYEIR